MRTGTRSSSCVLGKARTRLGYSPISNEEGFQRRAWRESHRSLVSA